eukprot:15082920-Heterocapsa_arctica.AAC.1
MATPTISACRTRTPQAMAPNALDLPSWHQTRREITATSCGQPLSRCAAHETKGRDQKYDHALSQTSEPRVHTGSGE